MTRRAPGPVAEARRVASREELEACLAQLPPPDAGLVRVYRGQTSEYILAGVGAPSISPSLSRSGFVARDPDPVWLTAAVQAMRRVGALRESDDLVARDVWAPAILQHYGARSHFVDVTRDLDIALWFACHELVMRWAATLPPVSIRGWMEQQLLLATYQPVAPSAHPVLYVMDVPRWRPRLEARDGGASGGLRSGRHGELVEVEAVTDGEQLQRPARRLARQRASLLWCDPRAAHGGSTHDFVVARYAIDGAMAAALPGQLGKSLSNVFPPPDEDEMYRALLGIPTVLHFDPPSLRHPLNVPLYVSSIPQGGTDADPVRLGRVDAATDDRRELTGYLAGLTLRNPSFLHRDLLGVAGVGSRLTTALTVGGQQFRFEDALPLLLDAPLWSVTPGCHEPEDRGMWIESALRVGLPDAVDGKAAHSVYVELSPLDAPGADAAILRGVWVGRALDEVVVRAYFAADGAVTSVQQRFRWGADGKLHASPLPGLPPRPLQGTAIESHLLKSAFTTFAILRNLAPGFKPPAAHAARARRADGTMVFQPGVVLEPPCGRVSIAGDVYVRPLALDGSAFAFASGFVGEREISDPRARLDAWCEFVPKVTDPFYTVSAGIPLVEHLAFFDEFARAQREIERIRSVLAAAAERSFDDVIDTLDAQLKIATGEVPAAIRILLAVADRASAAGRHDAAEACRALAANPMKRHWGTVETFGPMQIFGAPRGDPRFLL